MPHKINPINFENSMANVKMANAILTAFTENLQISRMQRDLSDSSMLRNIGTAIGYTLIAIKQSVIGMGKLKVNEEILEKELENTPEVLAEAVQTILRKNKHENAYETLKTITRGKNISMEEMRNFIKQLKIDKSDKEILLKLEPKNYTGLAEQLAITLNTLTK